MSGRGWGKLVSPAFHGNPAVRRLLVAAGGHRHEEDEQGEHPWPQADQQAEPGVLAGEGEVDPRGAQTEKEDGEEGGSGLGILGGVQDVDRVEEAAQADVEVEGGDQPDDGFQNRSLG